MNEYSDSDSGYFFGKEGMTYVLSGALPQVQADFV